MKHSPHQPASDFQPRHVSPTDSSENLKHSPGHQPNKIIDASAVPWERVCVNRLSEGTLAKGGIKPRNSPLLLATREIDAVVTLLERCSGALRVVVGLLWGEVTTDRPAKVDIFDERAVAVEEAREATERIADLERLALCVVQAECWLADLAKLTRCSSELIDVQQRKDKVQARGAEIIKLSEHHWTALTELRQEAEQTRQEDQRVDHVERALVDCPRRLRDLGDYLARLYPPARNTIKAIRLAHAVAIEEKRKRAYKLSFRKEDQELAPVLSLPATSSSVVASLRITPVVVKIRERLADWLRPELTDFAKPTLARWQQAKAVRALAIEEGSAIFPPEAIYHGSERQRDAREGFAGAVKRLFQQFGRQPLVRAAYQFTPFYLDQAKIAEVIDASESVAEELLAKKSLSEALATDLPPQFTWRNRGPFVHAILSFKPGYQPSNAQLAVYSRRLLVALGADPWRYQYAIIRHHDAPNAHAHLVWSRIRDDGALLSHPALTRDRMCHLLGGIQDALVVGKTYRDALGGTSRACLMADHRIDSGGSTARLMHTNGRIELIHLQGESAAKRLAAVGLLDEESIGGMAKVVGYWSATHRASDGRAVDSYLARNRDT